MRSELASGGVTIYIIHGVFNLMALALKNTPQTKLRTMQRAVGQEEDKIRICIIQK
jgi:hypothetical protein